MLSVVTFKWHTPGYRAVFTSQHVNTLQRMVARHYPHPHRIVCITDEPEGLAPGIQVVPQFHQHAAVPNPTGGGRPSCYRRLRLFAPDIAELVGERFVMLDLDCVIVGDLSPLWNRPEDVVFWRQPNGEWPYNGAMQLLRAGARPQVWTDFDPVRSPQATHAAGYRGSDQAWISLKLGWGEAVWTEADGVHYYHALPLANRNVLPPGARIVLTASGKPPWRLRHPWVRTHYR